MKYPAMNVGNFITLIKKLSVADIGNIQRRHICIFRFLAHVHQSMFKALKNITSLRRLLVEITSL